jgi:hypothetical protein
MTPFELTLRNELDVEWQRFANKWLFQWHMMNVEGKSFQVEDFRGGTISYGGILFGGQQQSVYWQAIGRYLKGKVHESFRRWDEETKSYPSAMRQSSLEGLNRILWEFVGHIMRNAYSTDQALRGRGHPKKDKAVEGTAVHANANAEIERLNQAHMALLPRVEEPSKSSRVERFFDAINLKPGMFGFSVDLKKLFQRKK